MLPRPRQPVWDWYCCFIWSTWLAICSYRIFHFAIVSICAQSGGAARPVFGVERVLALVGQPVLRTTAFQVPAGVFNDCGHLRRTPKVGWRTSTVPILYLWTKGLTQMPLP
jgi:hypothetical protein